MHVVTILDSLSLVCFLVSFLNWQSSCFNRKRGLVILALLKLCCGCLISVPFPHGAVDWSAFPSHTHLFSGLKVI